MQIAQNNTVRPLIVAKVAPSKTNVIQHDIVRLMPGANEIDDDTVAVIQNSATAQHWVEKGWLRLSAPKKADGEGLDGFEPGAAVTFVTECMDLSTLERWAEVEKRKEVKAAIKKRSKELERALDHETRGVQA